MCLCSVSLSWFSKRPSRHYTTLKSLSTYFVFFYKQNYTEESVVCISCDIWKVSLTYQSVLRVCTCEEVYMVNIQPETEVRGKFLQTTTDDRG